MNNWAIVLIANLVVIKEFRSLKPVSYLLFYLHVAAYDFLNLYVILNNRNTIKCLEHQSLSLKFSSSPMAIRKVWVLCQS
jgi:hypothetical protein